MQPIYCGNGTANGGQGHYLARINGAHVEFWCSQCKRYHSISIVDLVRGVVIDHQNGTDTETEKQLLW
ncbi:MAG: hypothetical protein KDH89_13070 [Anaerolineae bacterium]|nr:hypothetical protein [Anaerolineae bacterium]